MGRACSLPSPPRYAPGGRRRFGAGQSPAPKPKARPGAKAPGRAFAGALRPRRPPRDAAVSCALPAHPFPQHPRHHFDFLRSPGPSFPAAPRYRFDFLYPLRVPPPFPLRNPPYPKSLLETAEGGFQGRAIRSPWRSTPYTLCIPRRGPLPFRPPLPLRNFSGVWGRSRPQPGVQGRGRPWPWRSQYHKVSPTQSLSEFTPIPLPTHKKAPFGAVA